MEEYNIGLADYIVIGISLLIATGIGIWFRFYGNRENTTVEYLLAGKDMSKLPVVLSATVTILSATSMVGTPAEVYRYGFSLIIQTTTTLLAIVVSAYLFIPVYYACGVSTVYQFLEIRYGNKLRHTVSVLFVIQMLFYSCVALLAPALVLSAVSDFSTEVCIFSIGLVCTFYSTVGGLRGILWTDVFQAILMLTCVISVYSKAIPEAGGIGEVYRIALEGKRLDVWNFSPDMTLRYTTWGMVIKGFLMGLFYFGASQTEVQRILTLRNCQRAKSSLVWSSFTSYILAFLCLFLGVVMYAIYHSCDPVIDGHNTGLKKYDQMIPYYIATRFSSTPGVTGLCMAGILSGSLSSISSAINAAAMVTVVDFAKPIFSTLITERRAVIIAISFTAVYGVLCMCLAFAISSTDSLVRTMFTLLGTVDGPILAIFLMGVLSRKGTDNCALVGLLFGVAVSSWIGFGSLFSGYRHPPLPLSTSGCREMTSLDVLHNSTFPCSSNSSCMLTNITSVSAPFVLYRISYVWVTWIGFCSTMVFAFSSAFVTGWKNVIPSDSKCISPLLTGLWKKTQSWTSEKMLNIPLEESKCMIPRTTICDHTNSNVDSRQYAGQ